MFFLDPPGWLRKTPQNTETPQVAPHEAPRAYPDHPAKQNTFQGESMCHDRNVAAR